MYSQVPSIKVFRRNLKKLMADPLSMLTDSTDLFGTTIASDPIFTALQDQKDMSYEEKRTLYECLTKILAGTRPVVSFLCEVIQVSFTLIVVVLIST